jgi:hypothetical protein
LSLMDLNAHYARFKSKILFLNKTDLFAEKVGRFPISNYFPDYEGGKDDAEAGMAYFKKR